jgi:co-chaperonin GroES (HSP10)
MAIPKATNNFIFIIRDEIETEKAGLYIPNQGQEKPSRGEIFSIGGKVTDPDIKKSKGMKGVFHKGIGFTIDIDGAEYLVLQEHEIIAILP